MPNNKNNNNAPSYMSGVNWTLPASLSGTYCGNYSYDLREIPKDSGLYYNSHTIPNILTPRFNANYITRHNSTVPYGGEITHESPIIPRQLNLNYLQVRPMKLLGEQNIYAPTPYRSQTGEDDEGQFNDIPEHDGTSRLGSVQANEVPSFDAAHERYGMWDITNDQRVKVNNYAQVV